MITIQPEIEILSTESYEDMLRRIEKIGRVCYKSEERIGEGTAEKFIAGIIKRGHESVIEHGSITVKVTCDRGVTHEIVRHRIASYSQESTRYCNYSKDKFGNQITCIDLATGFSYDPYGRVVFYHWNGMVARGLISDGVYYYNMDADDGHYLGQFPVR